MDGMYLRLGLNLETCDAAAARVPALASPRGPFTRSCRDELHIPPAHPAVPALSRRFVSPTTSRQRPVLRQCPQRVVSLACPAAQLHKFYTAAGATFDRVLSQTSAVTENGELRSSSLLGDQRTSHNWHHDPHLACHKGTLKVRGKESWPTCRTWSGTARVQAFSVTAKTGNLMTLFRCAPEAYLLLY